MTRKKLRMGNDTYDLLIDLIMNLSPIQAEGLYKELLPRYTTRGRVRLYNAQGEEDKNGRIRLVPYQYRAIRTKYGDTYVHKAFKELSDYIQFLEEHQNNDSKYKAKLNQINKGTHNALIGHPNGWVYRKCKSFICHDRPKQVNVNPYLIDDIATAREYLLMIPRDTWNDSMDVQSLLMRFPTLATEELC
ncbi:MAG: hypothetical protein NC218_08110 [Acetobacter sp.]|nr:hypothetical protein [Acetobacter sp.]